MIKDSIEREYENRTEHAMKGACRALRGGGGRNGRKYELRMTRGNDPEKRSRILAAARKVFLEGGYGGASMAKVASESGLAVGTLYLYFESKEELASSLEEELFRRIEEEVVPMLPQMSSPGGIESILDLVIRITTDEADILKINNSGPAQDTSMRRKLRNTVARAMGTEMDEGRIRRTDPDAMADLVITIVEQAVYQGLVYGDPETDMDIYRDVLVDMVRRVILP